jgi:hypothetical protein
MESKDKKALSEIDICDLFMLRLARNELRYAGVNPRSTVMEIKPVIDQPARVASLSWPSKLLSRLFGKA